MLSLSKHGEQLPLRASFDRLRMTAAPEEKILHKKEKGEVIS